VEALERETIKRVSLRLIPFLFLLYIFCFLDRTNIALAALQMNRDLRFSNAAFGLGSGIFFIGYAIFEIPSNLILSRVGARTWIARIMITWGFLAAGMMLVKTPAQFYIVRFLLGAAEAGFFPGMVYYLTNWYPAQYRARAISRFMIAIPMSGVIGGVLGGFLLGLDGKLGIAGWQWLLLLEGLPSILLGVVVFFYLTDYPSDAHWLTERQRQWLTDRIRAEKAKLGTPHEATPLKALQQPMVWLLSIPYFLTITVGYGYTFWSPTVFKETLNISNTQTALLSAGIALCSTLTMLVVGASSDRRHERFFHAAAGGILSAIGFTGAALLTDPLLRVASLALVLIGANSTLPVFWCVPSMFLTGSAAAVGIALINAIGNTGGFAGPYMIGFVRDLTGGVTVSFLVLAGMAVAFAITCVLLRQHERFVQLPTSKRPVFVSD
jgi:sugar phosphate permease